MLGIFDGLRSSIKVSPGQFERCVLLLQLCREARTSAVTAHLDHADDLDCFVDFAFGYIRGVAESHANTLQGRDEHDFEKYWKDTMNNLKSMVSLISTNIERRFEDAMELDRLALERFKETKGKIERKERIEKLTGEGKFSEILLYFADELSSNLVIRVYEVPHRTSADSLAALIILSKRTSFVTYPNFYRTEGRDFKFDPANWEGEAAPNRLMVIMDRGRFEVNVPGLPRLCNNMFMTSKHSPVYLRDSVGTLHQVPSEEDIGLQLSRRDLPNSSVSIHFRWIDVYHQVRKEMHPKAHWVVETSNITVTSDTDSLRTVVGHESIRSDADSLRTLTGRESLWEYG